MHHFHIVPPLDIRTNYFFVYFIISALKTQEPAVFFSCILYAFFILYKKTHTAQVLFDAFLLLTKRYGL